MANLINLKGSEKQIKWANEIRAKFLAASLKEVQTSYATSSVATICEMFAQRQSQNIADTKARYEMCEKIRGMFIKYFDAGELELTLVESFNTQSSAKFWIDARDNSISQIEKQISFEHFAVGVVKAKKALEAVV